MYDLTDGGSRHYVGSNYLVINAMQFTSTDRDDEIISIANILSSELQSNNKSKILFEILSEGLPFNQISTCQRIIKHFLKNHNFNIMQFAFSFGAQPCTQNIIYYREHCKRFDWVEVPAYFFNHWELNMARFLSIKNSPYNHIDITPRLKDKKFLCYNRNVKAHRLYITTEIIKRGLLNKGYLSNYFDFNNDEFILWSLHETFPNKTADIVDTLTAHKHLFPLDLGLGSIQASNPNKFISVQSDDLHHFNDTYFGIVTETKYATDDYSIYNRIKSDLSLDCYFFTEKIWKFVAARKPFLLAGFPNSLGMLRQMGYKTFHPYIDETYDTVEDNELRLELIVKEIERLCNMSDNEILKWQYQTNTIVTHNYNVLQNAVETHMTFLPKT